MHDDRTSANASACGHAAPTAKQRRRRRIGVSSRWGWGWGPSASKDHNIDGGRRALLETSALGGLAVVASLLGSGSATVDAEGAQAAGTIALTKGRMRRVVTAHNAEGKSYIANDEIVDAANLWSGAPERPLGTTTGTEPTGVTHATGQTRCFVAAIPPSNDPKPTTVNRIGYHRANGIAYCLILNGALTFLVDTQEVVVRAGDVVVERNTLHSWRNEGAEPVSMFIVTVSAVGETK